MISVRSVELGDPMASALWAEQQRELFVRYGEPDADAHFALAMPPDALVTSLVAFSDEGEAVGTGLLRWSPFASGAGSVEVKRLYVRPEHRGHGHSRVIMGALEHAAARAGAVRIVLETGVEQPEAISLYEDINYSRIPGYGEYMDDPRSVCFAKELPTRVLIVNGTIGAGKTKVAGAVHDALAARGSRTAFIDGDYLSQAEPNVPGAPFNHDLLLANLSAVAPVYRAAGYGLMVIAIVIEDGDDRARYADAFHSAGGPGEVTIARVTAPESERFSRIMVRDHEPEWQQWSKARTVELERSLDVLSLDDVEVSNSDRLPSETAEELLAAIDW